MLNFSSDQIFSPSTKHWNEKRACDTWNFSQGRLSLSFSNETLADIVVQCDWRESQSTLAFLFDAFKKKTREEKTTVYRLSRITTNLFVLFFIVRFDIYRLHSDPCISIDRSWMKSMQWERERAGGDFHLIDGCFVIFIFEWFSLNLPDANHVRLVDIFSDRNVPVSMEQVKKRRSIVV